MKKTLIFQSALVALAATTLIQNSTAFSQNSDAQESKKEPFDVETRVYKGKSDQYRADVKFKERETQEKSGITYEITSLKISDPYKPELKPGEVGLAVEPIGKIELKAKKRPDLPPIAPGSITDFGSLTVKIEKREASKEPKVRKTREETLGVIPGYYELYINGKSNGLLTVTQDSVKYSKPVSPLSNEDE